MRFARSKIDLAMFLMAPIVARKSYADYTSGQRRLWVKRCGACQARQLSVSAVGSIPTTLLQRLE
jgi:hypothetical protein